MRAFPHRYKVERLILLLAVWLSACGQVEPPVPSPTATRTPGPFVRYSTPTLTRTPLPATPLPLVTMTPAPTPTPFVHTIVQGDTLGAIAYRYGVSIDEILAANPGVDPGFLTIGNALVIPLGGEIAQSAPSPTPIPLESDGPVCYLTSAGGLWCFVLVFNNQENPLENLSAWVGLFDSTGKNTTSQTATAPLNLLRSGQAMPLAAYFPPPQSALLTARAEIVGALGVADGDARYLPAVVEVTETNISATGVQAAVRGDILLPEGAPPPRVVWLALVAYDANDRVVGMRKWEAGESPCQGWAVPPTPEPSATPSGTTAGTPAGTATGIPAGTPTSGYTGDPAICLSFDVDISSLGPPIQRVEVMVEARR